MTDNDQKNQKEKSLLLVYTGDGKGKTTAALGMCLRAVGYNWHVCIIQFVKGSWKYGELKGLKRLEPEVELHVIGEGFVDLEMVTPARQFDAVVAPASDLGHVGRKITFEPFTNAQCSATNRPWTWKSGRVWIR